MKYKIEKYLKLVDKGFYPTYDELSDYLYDPCGVKEVEKTMDTLQKEILI